MRQPLTFGTTAWRISYNQRQLVETGNSGLKGGFVNMTRDFCRVFGLVKRTFLFAFSIAGYNTNRTRAFLARRAEEEKRRSAPRKRAKRRKGTLDDLLGPPRPPTGPDPPPD